jgi:hypothetical protein
MQNLFGDCFRQVGPSFESDGARLAIQLRNHYLKRSGIFGFLCFG